MVTKGSYYKYWAKIGKDEAGSYDFHLLPYHCLDVAAVGIKLADRMGIAQALTYRLPVSKNKILAFIGFLCSVHDIGKFSNEFQGLEPEIVKVLRNIELKIAYQEKHWSTGHRFLREYAGQLFNGPKDDILDLYDSWFSSSSGHHGRPPMHKFGVASLSMQFPGAVKNDTFQFMIDMKSLFEICDDDWKLLNDEEIMKETSWQLAGIMVLADWIGSNTRWFPYIQKEYPVKEYWENIALMQAEQAVLESGIMPLSTDSPRGVLQLFAHIKQATPLQKLVEQIPLSEKPNMLIIEEITGSGKTEAALTLAHRMMADGHAEGLYFGLPTMATANAMYERIESVYRKLYEPSENPALILAHSASRQLLSLEKNKGIPDIDDEKAEVDASVWLFDNRKKALLAHVGVGTIDQALLAILPARHQSLRLLGLHRKVLIVDEVHAYDSYMNKLLCTLLKFHAAQGGNAILLSATLPIKLRKEFLRAFAEGRKIHYDIDVEISRAYPLVSGIIGDSFIEKSINTPIHLEKEVLIRPVYDENEALKYIHYAIQKGKNVCWVRNTVFDAQRAFDALCNEIESSKNILFHARYALGDRLQIEKEIIRCFGNKSCADQRHGKIVIATQVVEQSLDIDFDCMISDLAPIDLIIQRAGRLCRHNRNEKGDRIEPADQRGAPELVLYMPSLEKDTTSDWYSAQFPKACRVYAHHGQLWLTAKWLYDHKKFHMPNDAREMIEFVYSDSGENIIPKVLERQENIAGGDDRARAGIAQYQALRLEDGYMPDCSKWLEDEKVPTRLGEIYTTVRLALWNNDMLIPYFNNNWQLSEVAVSSHWISSDDEEYRVAIENAKEKMYDRGKYCVVIPMFEEESHFIGTAMNKNGEKIKISYDNKRGLKMQKLGEKT